ncbi:adenylate/guanylate cyclase domain-containing protein [Actinotalea sp. Marseille-Q4924]|uniref:adenylate/guanylate cyclase domain-containing protein n=1 Tax=Actinotalea sp. Marseille-Q4924 TaxID=2866571 RepID=UPI001CE47764|nr:adenylate/guanylate cyclase domain-containing protein [Actinotalea sp. Marseille-Q4924]
MLTPGETRFARSGQVDIAYQVVGEGERDLLVGIGWVSHLELLWELPETVRFLERLGRLGRLILFDARGTGLSDRPPGSPAVEKLVPDALAVLDAAGSERAVVVGWLDKAALAMALAAHHPERVEALVLGEASASMLARPGHPWGMDPADGERLAAAVESGAWGTGTLLPWIAPGVAGDPRVTAWWRRWERMSATPNTAAGLLRTLVDVDLRHLLPAVRAPALLVHRSGTGLVPAASVRWLADALPDARVVELDGADLPAFFGDTDTLMDEVEEFLGGTRTGSDADRRVLTMLVTDVVGSTEQAARLGDRRWDELLAWHHRRVRALLARHGGQEVDTAGDGFLAVFNLPSRAVTCALAIRDDLAAGDVTIRAGVHAGEVVRGPAEVRGLAVHVAARVASSAEPGEVRATATVRDLLLGTDLRFTARGTAELKGVPGRWGLYAADAPAP